MIVKNVDWVCYFVTFDKSDNNSNNAIVGRATRFIFVPPPVIVGPPCHCRPSLRSGRQWHVGPTITGVGPKINRVALQNRVIVILVPRSDAIARRLTNDSAAFIRKLHCHWLIHWSRDEMDISADDFIFKRISSMKMFQFRLTFHWSLFLRVQLTIFQHWFRWWLGAGQATSHCLNQWCLVYWRIYASLGLDELRYLRRRQIAVVIQVSMSHSIISHEANTMIIIAVTLSSTCKNFNWLRHISARRS